MELRHLRYFVAVAEELNFGRAAQRLGIAQPPLSQQIRKLEEELGVLLFERSTRRHVQLTGAGNAFLGEARAALHQAQQAVLAAQRAARGQEGHLAIGVAGSVTFELLPAMLRTFRQRFPLVSLTLRELPSGDQLEALRQDRIQLGLLRAGPEAYDLQLEALMREPMVAALPASHPLARSAQVRLEEFAREPMILTPPTAGCQHIRDLVVSACHKAGFSPVIAQEATQLPTILGLVAAELGLALVPESVTAMQIRGLVYRPLAPPAPHLELALAQRRDDRSPLVQAFCTVAREVVAAGKPAAAQGLRLIPGAS